MSTPHGSNQYGRIKIAHRSYQSSTAIKGKMQTISKLFFVEVQRRGLQTYMYVLKKNYLHIYLAALGLS